MRKKQFWIVVMILLLLLSIAGSLILGSKQISFQDVLYAFVHPDDTTFSSLVVWERLPRTVFALMAGAALGIAGSLMQSITRNPIADPSILGINTGAALFVVMGISFLHIASYWQYIGMALLGASITAAVVYGIASMGIGGATPIKLALSGAIIGAAFSSMVSAVMLPNSAVMNAYRFWQVGSVSGATWQGIITVSPFLLVGGIVAILLANPLNALELGDELAIGLGVKTSVVRMLGAFASVLLCGSVTALAGPIGFVGLLIPHIMRHLFGAGVRKNMLLSALGGACLLLVGDVIGRMLGSPGELEVGIITAFIGAPMLIMIARKAKVSSL